MMVSTENCEYIIPAPWQLHLLTLLLSLHSYIINKLLADGLCLHNVQLVKVDFELCIETLSIINYIEGVPCNLPTYLLLPFIVLFMLLLIHLVQNVNVLFNIGTKVFQIKLLICLIAHCIHFDRNFLIEFPNLHLALGIFLSILNYFKILDKELKVHLVPEILVLIFKDLSKL